MSTARSSTPAPGTAGRIGYRQLAHLAERVSDRDRAILGTLARLRYATTRQRQRLWFDPTAVSPLAAARAAQRTLARLHRLGLVDPLKRRIGGVRAGSSGYVWRLAPAGARLLGQNISRRLVEPGLHTLTHDLEITELVTRLYEHARAGVLTLVAVETQPDCWRTFTHRHGQRWLKPDLRVTLATNDDYDLHWFIEIDRGTEGPAALSRKIATYLAAWHDGTEQAAAGCFPCVAWITPDRPRADRIAALCAATSGVPAGMFTATATADAIATLTREKSHEGDPVGH